MFGALGDTLPRELSTQDSLIGQPGGTWTIGSGTPVATVRLDTVDYLRTLSGRNDNPTLNIDGDPAVTTAVTTARVVF